MSLRQRSLQFIERTRVPLRSLGNQVRLTQRLMRSEFVSGFFYSIQPSIDILFLVQMAFLLCSIIFWNEFYMIEINLLLRTALKTEFRIHNFAVLAFSRLLTLYLYTQEKFDFPFESELLILPIGLSWYVFEPMMILNRKSYGERFEYFVSRFPFFTGFGLLSAIFSYFDLVSSAHFFILLMSVSSSASEEIIKGRPQYSKGIPYTKNTFSYDPIEGIEFILQSLNSS